VSWRLGARPRSRQRSLERWGRSRTPCVAASISSAQQRSRKAKPFDIVVRAVGQRHEASRSPSSRLEVAATAVLWSTDVPVDGSFPGSCERRCDVVDRRGRAEFEGASPGRRRNSGVHGAERQRSRDQRHRRGLLHQGGTGKRSSRAISRPRWPGARFAVSLWTSTTISATCSRTSAGTRTLRSS
jgi:hypothetical protein